MKRPFLLVLVLGIVTTIVGAWLIIGSGTAFSEKKKYLYIKSDAATPQAVMQALERNGLVKNPLIFRMLASQMKVWDKLKPGRFEISKGESLLNIARTLRNNRQAPVSLVINKLRLPQDLAKLIGKNFETDSASVMKVINDPAKIRSLGADENTVMSILIPNTYNILWTTSAEQILERLKTEQAKFWSKNNRSDRARQLGFTPLQVTTIASIVEEETNKQDEKGNIASVYINRYNIGMALGADPTIKFALKDFGIKRIYNKHLDVVSPFNTYRNKGLPPGPICTPSPKTIDAVLDAPKTEYLFFVARSDFSGYHTFSTNYAEHLQHAKEFAAAQNEQALIRQQKAAR